MYLYGYQPNDVPCFDGKSRHGLVWSSSLFILFCCLSFGLGAQGIEGRLYDASGRGLSYVVLGLYDLEHRLCQVCQTDSLGLFHFVGADCRGPRQLRLTHLEGEQVWVLDSAEVFHELEFEFGVNLGDLAFEGRGRNLEEVKRSSSASLAGRMEDLAGLHIQTLGVGMAKPVLRGLVGHRLPFLYNGLRQEGQQWGSDHSLEADPFDLDLLEVLQGPLALRYGGDGLSGLIQVQSSKHFRAGEALMEAEGQYKTNNEHLGGSWAWGWGWKHWSFSGRASVQSYADYRVPADRFRYNGFELPLYEQRLKNTAGLEHSQRWTLSHLKGDFLSQFTYTRYYLDAGIFSGAVGIPRSYALEPDGNWRNRSLPSQTVLHQRFLARHGGLWEGLKWSLLLGWQDNHRREWSFPHAHNGLHTDSTFLALGLRLQTWEGQVHGEFGAWQGGWQGQFQRNEARGFEFLLPNFRYQKQGLYLIWRGGDLGAWRYQLGWRGEYAQHEQDFGGVVMAREGNRFDRRAEALVRHFWGWAASGQVEYRPKLGQAWLGRLQRGYRPPYAHELGSNGVHHGTFRHEMGRGDLNAERYVQLELAWTLERKLVYAEVKAFSSYYDNYLFLQPTARFSPLAEAGQLYRYAEAGAWFNGAEASVVWDFWPRWSFRQAWDVLFSKNLETGFALPFTPPWSLLQQLRYEHGPWALSLRHRYYGAQNLVDRNELASPSAHLFGFRVGIALPRGWRLGLEAENLFNQVYLRHLSRYRLLDLPEQGRNWVISLAYAWKRSL